MTTAPAHFEQTGKFTLYIRSEFMGNYKRVEVRAVRGRLRKYAQYSSALEVSFLSPRERNERGVVQTKPSLVVVRGWGHPEPLTWKSGVEDGLQETAHTAFSPEWDNDFAEMLRASIEESDIVADYRGHNPYSALPSSEVA
jgi:hypothetical protein